VRRHKIMNRLKLDRKDGKLGFFDEDDDEYLQNLQDDSFDDLQDLQVDDSSKVRFGILLNADESFKHFRTELNDTLSFNGELWLICLNESSHSFDS